MSCIYMRQHENTSEANPTLIKFIYVHLKSHTLMIPFSSQILCALILNIHVLHSPRQKLFYTTTYLFTLFFLAKYIDGSGSIQQIFVQLNCIFGALFHICEPSRSWLCILYFVQVLMFLLSPVTQSCTPSIFFT
jgi:hypothetical protein